MLHRDDRRFTGVFRLAVLYSAVLNSQAPNSGRQQRGRAIVLAPESALSPVLSADCQRFVGCCGYGGHRLCWARIVRALPISEPKPRSLALVCRAPANKLRVTRKGSDRELVCGLFLPGGGDKKRAVCARRLPRGFGGDLRSLARFKFASAMPFPGSDGY